MLFASLRLVLPSPASSPVESLYEFSFVFPFGCFHVGIHFSNTEKAKARARRLSLRVSLGSFHPMTPYVISFPFFFFMLSSNFSRNPEVFSRSTFLPPRRLHLSNYLSFSIHS